MRRICCFLFVFCLLLAGCQNPSLLANSSPDPSPDPSTETSPASSSNSTTAPQPVDPVEPQYNVISVRSLSELETMRSMSTSSDTEAVQAYLLSLEGGGAQTQNDLKNFLTLVDKVPKLELLEGEITWISLQYSDTQAVLHISVTAESGDWFRTEYMLHLVDSNAQLNWLQSDSQALLDTPISAQNNRIRIYTQSVTAHENQPGYTTAWRLTVDEYCAFLYYYSDAASSASAAEIFQNASIVTDFADT